MTGIQWSLAHAAAQLLAPSEREAVLGDLVEAGASARQGFLEILGLVIRRRAVVWKSWRPYLAAFGLALPSTLMLLGFSLSVTQGCQQFFSRAIPSARGLTMGPGLPLLLCNLFLLAGWSWAGGFVVGSVSRRTVWVSAALSFLPCLFCLARFHVESLSRFCLLLFLPPAIWGVRQGLQLAHIELKSALVLAAGVTVLTIPAWHHGGPWIPNWALSWPAWYLVATSWRNGREAGRA